MSIEEYYFARNTIPRFGKLFFLKVLQEADSSGGGESLLGSVVQEVEDKVWGIFPGKEYPVPIHMSAPTIVRKAIEENKGSLGIE